MTVTCLCLFVFFFIVWLRKRETPLLSCFFGVKLREQRLVCRHQVEKWKPWFMETLLLDFLPVVASLLLFPSLSHSLLLAPTSHLFNVLVLHLGRNGRGWLCFSETVSFVIDEGSEGVKPWGTKRQIVGCFFSSLGHI